MGVYTVVTKRIHVVGKGWYGQTMAYAYNLDSHDLESLGDYRSRADVQDWLDRHAGDFQCVDDFRTDVADFDSGWETEEGELAYSDCMYGSE